MFHRLAVFAFAFNWAALSSSKQLAASLPKTDSIIKTLHKSKASATKLFESNELVTLRMAHKVDEMKEQQQNFIASFNNNNPFARSQSEETHVRSKGQYSFQ